MTLLARRDFTVRELSERLIERGIGEAAAAAAVAELLRDGVLDDGRYAHNYVAWHAGRGGCLANAPLDEPLRQLPHGKIATREQCHGGEAC